MDVISTDEGFANFLLRNRKTNYTNVKQSLMHEYAFPKNCKAIGTLKNFDLAHNELIKNLSLFKKIGCERLHSGVLSKNQELEAVELNSNFETFALVYVNTGFIASNFAIFSGRNVHEIVEEINSTMEGLFTPFRHSYEDSLIKFLAQLDATGICSRLFDTYIKFRKVLELRRLNSQKEFQKSWNFFSLLFLQTNRQYFQIENIGVYEELCKSMPFILWLSMRVVLKGASEKFKVYDIHIFLFISQFTNVIKKLQTLKYLFLLEERRQCINVYIHGSIELGEVEKSIETYDNIKEFPTSLMCIQIVVLTSGYNSQISREISRYSDTSSVLIFPVQNGRRIRNNYVDNKYIELVVYKVFDAGFHLSVTSLFLLVDNSDLFKRKGYSPTFDIQKHPTNVMLLAFKSKETRDGQKIIAPYVNYLCYKYCSQRWMSSNEFGNILPPIDLHKKMLYNSNSMSVSVGLRPDTRRIDPSMEMIHNFTFTIYNIRDSSEKKAYHAESNPFIDSPLRKRFRKNIEFVYSLMYEEDTSATIYYCIKYKINTDNDSKVMHWIYPFTASVWIILLQLLLGIPSIVTIIFTKSIPKTISVVIGTVSGVIGHGNGTIGRTMFAFISLFGFIICSFYESQITSLAIAQQPPQIIQSLNELINKGYKILTDEESNIQKFEIDFKIRNMEKAFNQSWFLFGKGIDNYNKHVELNVKLLAFSNSTLKYASFTRTNLIEYNLREKTERIRQHTGIGDYNCHSIPDTIGQNKSFWNLGVKNRYWIEKTAHKVQSAGLQERWNRWSDIKSEWEFIMNERRLRKSGKWLGESIFGTHSLGPGLVGVAELGSFMLLLLCPFLTGILCLILEVYSKCKHDVLEGKVVATIVRIEWKSYRSKFVYPICNKYGD
ncbi:unnamed protein product [Orchesella dallaii]|uniref:Uncharacterized protein n=1 Tax=Orchesella dallaii TaxID=48710 RepID=A0ABP1QCJ8_9HEXA